ncbi:Asp23/Gls24 family envelope stress response protein [Enterococcus sp. BWB1-3]|uniref:Asp23/Gls24 family envelope stress response protein n=1 Tax=Enterococcus sp. BWB1-3 TaxID=2787713 RepID=UPI001923B9CC|nr:Asp23/Gls24 family envelope stress response protein [Enterococcus sp. BWB1-3]MBL1230596.1 Asp23/Gls24 family envelope stress response protein [Enterococcus sp. BWB1-3]
MNINLGNIGELNFEDKMAAAISLEFADGLLNINGKIFSHATERLDENEKISADIDVEVAQKKIVIQVNSIIEYIKSIPVMYEAIQKIDSEEVEHMTSFNVAELNVNIIDGKKNSSKKVS